jgi:hypothetical protein
MVLQCKMVSVLRERCQARAGLGASYLGINIYGEDEESSCILTLALGMIRIM